MKTILFNLIFAFSLSIFIPTIVGLFTYTKMNRPLRVLYIYTIASAIVGLIESLMSLNTINNIYLVNIAALIGYSFLGTVYYLAFNFKKRYFFWIHILLLFLIGCLYARKAIFDIYEYNNELHAATSGLLIVASVAYLISEFRKAEPGPFSKQLILISFGAFMYYSSSFLILFIGSNSSSMPEIQTIIIYLIHSIFYLIFVITLTIAFWICRKPSEHLN